MNDSSSAFAALETLSVEGRGWAKMDKVTADNTYTGKGGSKRD
jgi:hypothetical protein